jgi:hypothetical protein
MIKLRIRTTDFTIRFISWLQIIGGISGLWLISTLLLQTGAITGGILFIFLIGISLYIFSIYSGNILLRGPNKKKGLMLSIVNQSFQLIQWSMFGYGFSYSCGLELLIGIKNLSFYFKYDILFSTFLMSINSNNDFFVKINIIPVFLLVILVDIYMEIRKKGKVE